MTLIEALLLGLIQGLTEFLPVSSSGHIELGKAVLGVDLKDGLLFTIVLHFATAISTILVFRNDILQLLRALFSFRWSPESRFAMLILLSMIPAALVGLTLEEEIESFFDENILFVGFMLIFTGFILFASDRMRSLGKEMDAKRSFLVGVMQAVAILPGISRSGSTIATAVLLRVDRDKAARFSFLMVLPLIVGAMGTKTLDYLALPLAEQQAQLDWPTTLLGFFAALISGYFACRWMITLVKRSQLTYFAVYCWIVGVIGVASAL